MGKIDLVNLNASFTIERHLASLGLQYFVEQAGVDHDYKVYGCGMFRPGESYDGFVDAYSHGEMIGIIGMTIEEESLSLHEGSLRQLLGHILMRAPKIFMTDFTSAEWAPHYDIQGAAHGGHPAWLCPAETARDVWLLRDPYPMNVNDPPGIAEIEKGPVAIYDAYAKINDDHELANPDDTKLVGIVVTTLGDCIAGALMQLPTIIYPNVYGCKDAAPGGQKRIMNHPMIRFASRFGVSKEVVVADGQMHACFEALRKDEMTVVSKQLVEAAQIEAYATLEKMLPQPAPAEDEEQVTAALSVFGPAQERVVQPDGSGSPTLAFSWGAPEAESESGPQTPEMPKVISPGDPFDPATHYGRYYYADGPGMVYTAPDGEKARYNGPGHDWEGFDTVADIFKMIFPFKEDCATMVSLGCGFGYDVLRFKKKGWDAWGCDISETSVGQAPPGARDTIILGNICDKETQDKLPKAPNLVCTFDFWEHIYLDDIDVLLADLAKWMPKGSFMANIICTTGLGERDMTIKPGEGFTQENSWFLISGHLTGRRWHWWANKFYQHGLHARLDLSYMFQVSRTEDSAMSQALSWRPRNLLIVEKV